MELIQEKSNDISIIKIAGKLDSNTSGKLEEMILNLINGGEKKLLIDCTDLSYISSAGLRVLLLAAKKLKISGGKIVLSALNEHLIEIFAIAGFTKIFPIFSNNSEAAAGF